MPDFKVGQSVLYVPYHARGDVYHKDVESGVVTGKNDDYIFVCFGDESVSKAVIRERLVLASDLPAKK